MATVGLDVLSAPCEACPFAGRLDLRAGRLRDLIDQTRREDTHFSCHRSLIGPDGEYPDYDQQAVCAGWLRAVGGLERCPGQLIRIAGRLGILHTITPEQGEQKWNH